MPRAGPSQNPDREPAGGANQLSDALQFGMQAIKELCKEVLPLCDADARKEITKKLDANFKKLVQADILSENSSKLIDSAAEVLATVEEDADDKVILKNLDHHKKLVQKERTEFERKTTAAVIKRNRHYIEFNEVLATALAEIETNDDGDGSSSDNDTDEINSDEEDEESVTDMVPIVDPISKRPLTDPVRNKICKHIYGKKSMVELIKQNQRVRCPTIGCPNQQFIREKDLQVDNELTRKVRHRVKKEKRQQQRMQQDYK